MKIKSINLELNGQKVEITIEEAKNLYRQLKELLGNEKEYYPVYPSYPYYRDTSPYLKEPLPWWQDPIICSTDDSKGDRYFVLTDGGIQTRSVVNFSCCGEESEIS